MNDLDGFHSSETKLCEDCGAEKPLDQFQRYANNERAKDCKDCRRKKSLQGTADRKAALEAPATKEWVISEAKRIYLDPKTARLSDKIKLLDTISRNLNGDKQGATDDAKVIRDLIQSKKRHKEIKGSE